MKKIKLMMVFVLALIFGTIGFAGCGAKPVKEETFESTWGLSITLNSKFYRTTSSFSMCLTDDNVVFMANREKKSSFVILGYDADMSLEEYAQLCIESNGLTCDIEHDLENDFVYFEYTNVSQGAEYYYFAVAKKGEYAYWLCQFACLNREKAKYQNKMVGWATTITINDLPY